jgi:hypothetical protein
MAIFTWFQDAYGCGACDALLLDIRMHMNAEEIICYKYELEFLYKIPNAGDYLIRHAKEQIGNRLISK